MSAVYNFNNCCCEQTNDGNDNTGKKDVILLRSAYDGILTDYPTGDVEYAIYTYPISTVATSGNLRIYNNLQLVHFKYRLLNVSFIKFQETGSTSEQMNLDFVVMDLAGTELRTVSQAAIDIVAIPAETWQPTALTTTVTDLVIDVGEVLVARFERVANSDAWRASGNCSALAELV